MKVMSCQPEVELPTSNGKSLNDILELLANELIEGHVYPKTKFLDVEDDTDYIDNFIVWRFMDEVVNVVGIIFYI